MNRCVIGVPKEVKPQEGRVGVTPDGVRALVAQGDAVIVETKAGELAGFSDNDYVSAGASISLDVAELYRAADMVVKVKELIPEEYYLIPFIKGKVLFTYLHLTGVDPELTKLLLEHKVTAIAYETVTGTQNGRTVFPLLVPMSRIAGVQAALAVLAHFAQKPSHELRGLIFGGGVVGKSALNTLLTGGVGHISLFERLEDRREELRRDYPVNTNVVFPDFDSLETYLDTQARPLLQSADFAILAVMSPGGAAAPKILTNKFLRYMKQGAYIADVAIDQGGATVRSRPTKPGETFVSGKNKLVFSCVPNIPGSTVPVEATKALTGATFPFISLLGASILEHGVGGAWYAMRGNKDLRAGLQTQGGYVTNYFVAEKYGLQDKYQELDRIF